MEKEKEKKKETEILKVGYLSKKFCEVNFIIDDAEKFTSEMHDPCARSRSLQKITTQKHLTEGTGVEPAKYPPKVKSEIFLQL